MSKNGEQIMPGINGFFKRLAGSRFADNKYDITKNEYKELRKDLEESNIELTRTQRKELKAAIKNGNLGDYLDQQSAKMQSALGLSLSSKVGKANNGTVQSAAQLAREYSDIFGNDCDIQKVIQYIVNSADTQIRTQQTVEDIDKSFFSLKLDNYINPEHDTPETRKNIKDALMDFDKLLK